jgi:CBS domain-containing protein
MNIGTYCRQEVVSAESGCNLRQAATLMREHHVGALLVTEDTPDGPQATGLITDRDLVIEAMARGFDGEDMTVGELGGGGLVTVPGTASIDEAIAAMQKEGVRRLLVSTPDGRLAGIVTLDDLLDALAGEMVGLARAIRSGIARESAERGPIITRADRAMPIPIA